MPTLTASSTKILDQDHARVGAWMGTHGAGYYRDGTTCIGLEREGKIVAAAMYDGFNGSSIFAHIAITGKMTREWLWFICYYPFVQLKCEVVIGLVSSANHAAQRFDEHFGFVKQCVIPGGDPQGDLIIYALRKADCRFLTKGKHYGQA